MNEEETRRIVGEPELRQAELEATNEALRRTELELEAQRSRYTDLYDLAPVGYCTVGEEGRIEEANLAAAALFGLPRGGLIGRSILDLVHEEDRELYQLECRRLRDRHERAGCELRLIRGEDLPLWVGMEMASPAETGGRPSCRIVMTDVSERRLQEEARELSLRLILRLDSEADFPSIMSAFTEALHAWSGCEAVGIRLREGEDFPYYETYGFPPRFVQSESSLCSRDAQGRVLRDEVGNPVLECMCGNVLSGRFDPALPFFTSRGSFWTNGSTALLADTSEADRQARTRNRCNGEGYESVALIPLRAGGQVLGLLQFNDRRRERFTRDRIALFEELAESLALALSRRQAVQALKEHESNLRQLFENMEEGFALHEIITDRDGSVVDFRFLEANRAYERHSGLKPADILGRSMLEVMPKADPGLIEKFGRVALTGEPLAYEYFSTLFGRHFHVRIFRASPRRFAAVFEDITERKRNEEELRQKNQLLENIFATSADYIFVKDRQLRTIMCNEAFSRLLGKRTEELIGKTDIENGWDPEHVKGNPEKGIVGYEQSDREALMGKMVRTVYDRRTELGGRLVVDAIKQPLRNSAGDIVGLLGISRDISDEVATRTALERRERELQALTRELRDLNGHLVGVREEERRAFAREIHDELGQRLTALSLGLYAIMGDPGKSRDELRSRLAGLVGLTKEAMAEIQTLASQMRPRILDDLGLVSALEWLVAGQGAPGGPAIALEQDLDEERITPELGTVVFRLVQESLTNIVRHAQAGHAIVNIGMDEHTLFLKVEDDGVGINAEQRGDPHSFGILGMRERVLSSGGRFSLHEAEGRGTVVTVELPLGKGAEAGNG
ncbi:MAG: PAS domain S-box protein [Treponema sp.]|nr:PAS domain S-box protein [Treponema sp.]